MDFNLRSWEKSVNKLRLNQRRAYLKLLIIYLKIEVIELNYRAAAAFSSILILIKRMTGLKPVNPPRTTTGSNGLHPFVTSIFGDPGEIRIHVPALKGRC